ncbi:monovalent cation/H(+) antiporter subunit G [Micromonospora sp. NBC_01813]|uniref:monovalent cation/H(+) antiporter subunit G n=1 Tax=Micromonospora sp. NBC_01813 TaxID=2975988 RepID=UPI002DD9282C|nr:monovalent cation/H(+) antiporter subunit G [Micromonospora sp. NBC_01813]WSA09673.1 monovalent cation/H(+) antiporter subunit G [Micromonospora sp. NBC_01813]
MTGQTVLAGLLLGAGTLLIGITAVGLLRLPDIYNRMNAVAKAASLGLILILLGVLVLLPSPRTAVVVTLAILLQLVTAPVGGYALARAAYRSGTPMAAESRFDALADDAPADAGHTDTSR